MTVLLVDETDKELLMKFDESPKKGDNQSHVALNHSKKSMVEKSIVKFESSPQ